MSSLNVSQIVRGVRLIEQIHNTRADWGQFYRWIAQVSVRKGRRADALRYFGRAALTGKMSEVRSDLSALIRAALHRQLGDRIALAPRRSDVAWEGEARTWLEELRCLEVGVGHDSSLGHHPNQKSK
jgi:hypothetical protein